MNTKQIIKQIAKENNICTKDVEKEIFNALYLSDFFDNYNIQKDISIDEVLNISVSETVKKLYKNT